MSSSTSPRATWPPPAQGSRRPLRSSSRSSGRRPPAAPRCLPRSASIPRKMPSCTPCPRSSPRSRVAGVKWVSAFPENRGRGLPTIAGLIVLNDPETGLPLAVMDAGWITAKRTAAASALAARHLARPDSRILGILGCGVQGQKPPRGPPRPLPDPRGASLRHRRRGRRAIRRGGGGALPRPRRPSERSKEGRLRLRPRRHRRPDPPRAPRDDPAGVARSRGVCLPRRLRLLLGPGGFARGRQVVHGRPRSSSSTTRR